MSLGELTVFGCGCGVGDSDRSLCPCALSVSEIWVSDAGIVASAGALARDLALVVRGTDMRRTRLSYVGGLVTTLPG